MLALTLTSFVFYQAMLIIPGQSVGHFFVNKTTLKNVKAILGKGEVKKLKWYAPHCGLSKPYFKLVYPDKGISFTFYTSELKKSDIIETIELTKSFIAQTEEQIAAGYSTRTDVYHAYGRPSDTTNARYVAYEELGISFEFMDSINQVNDTLKTMYIYKPTEK